MSDVNGLSTARRRRRWSALGSDGGCAPARGGCRPSLRAGRRPDGDHRVPTTADESHRLAHHDERLQVENPKVATLMASSAAGVRVDQAVLVALALDWFDRLG